MLLRRRLICVRRRDLASRFLSKEAAGEGEVFESDHRLRRRFEAAEAERPSSGSLLKVKEFFQKHKPPSKPAPSQPSKAWLLKRQPEPEEVTERPEDIPPVGDIEAERKWLNFGDYQTLGRQPLITHSDEFRRMAKDIEHEMDPRRAERPRNVPRYKVSRAFAPDPVKISRFQHYGQPGNDRDWQGDWLHQSIPARIGSRESYEDVDKRFDRLSGKTANHDHLVQNDGFIDIMTAMKQNAHQTEGSFAMPAESAGSKLSLSASGEKQPEEIVLHETVPQRPRGSQNEKVSEEAVYGRLTAEELSEDAFHSQDNEPNVYNYNPPRPKWLTPPDGESVGAPPQREFNDFNPSQAVHDFWNESSAVEFEDPGQDPSKPNRHKLYGQEYWVARPMLMEKYDYEDDEGIQEMAEDRHKDLDPEIPRHFVEDNGTISKLSIPEAREYVDFFDMSSKSEARPNGKRLFAMRSQVDPYTKTVVLKRNKMQMEGKVVPGYTVPQDEDRAEQWRKEVREWLYDIPTERDDGYQRLNDPSIMEVEIEDAQALLRADGYGKLEDVVTRLSRIPMPSSKRVQEIEVLEGLRPPEEVDKAALKDLKKINGSERYYKKVNVQNLHGIMEAERRYQDMFTNETSDELPGERPHDDAGLESLKKLNQPGTPETRPQNQLLHRPSQSDFDPWLLKELQKYKKNGHYEDVFALACHPKMLEIAFLSLKKRRPGTLPKALESNFFEMASRMLLNEDLKSGISLAPKKPRIDAGKGARSTRIPSHHQQHPYKTRSEDEPSASANEA